MTVLDNWFICWSLPTLWWCAARHEFHAFFSAALPKLWEPCRVSPDINLSGWLGSKHQLTNHEKFLVFILSSSFFPPFFYITHTVMMNVEWWLLSQLLWGYWVGLPTLWLVMIVDNHSVVTIQYSWPSSHSCVNIQSLGWQGVRIHALDSSAVLTAKTVMYCSWT